jgi:AmpE protein
MSLTLLATVLALALGHLAPGLAQAVRRHHWFAQWSGWLDAHQDDLTWWPRRGGIALALAPPVLLVLLLQWLLRDPLYGLGALAFGIGVLLHAWGPRDLDLDVRAVLEAGTPAERDAALATLADGGAVPTVQDPAALVQTVFRQALTRWFGVLLWFLLLGPAGAVLYRLAALAAAHRNLPAATAEGARTFAAWLDWPATQLVAAALALAADFDAVVGAWRQAGGLVPAAARAVLDATAVAGVRVDLADDVEDLVADGETPDEARAALGELPELRDAMSLVWRVLLIWLAVLALFVVAGWVS